VHNASQQESDDLCWSSFAPLSWNGFSLKTAVVTLILEKTNLDPTDFANYPPISNLPYVSKIIEKVIATQLQSFQSLNDSFHLYHRQYHGTETALVRGLSMTSYSLVNRETSP